MNICARNGCEERYHKKTHNQKYHNDECCRLATNQRIMEKYYAKRDQRSGKTRFCQECGVTKLSRYNDGVICSSCKSKKQIAANNSVVNLLMNVSLQA
jgi:hypothetical protein